MHISFEGQTAFVTGAGQGIGRATALAFARAGADVALCDLDQSGLDATAADIRAIGRRACPLLADISSENEVRAMVASAYQAFGRIDMLVNNAGISGSKTPLTELDMREFDRVLGVNLRGTVLCAKYVLPHMLEAGRGSVVNIASTLGRMGSAGKVPYVASKWAVIGVTQSLALEVASRGVRVNAVAPGYTMTDMMRSNREAQAAREGRTYEEAVAGVAALSPQNRIVSADEVASVVLWLSSDAAISIHGQTVNANAALFMN